MGTTGSKARPSPLTEEVYPTIREELKQLMNNPDHDDGSYAPVLIRLAWHSSGTYDSHSHTGGSNGATMRFKAEQEDPENKGLEVGRTLLEPVKQSHPEISYSDLWVLAAYVALEVTGGPVIPFRKGREDKVKEQDAIAPGRLPHAEFGLEDGVDEEGRIKGWENLAQHIRDVFYRMGFDDREIVALIAGGHMYGRCHPEHSGYAGAWVEDPTHFNNEFAADLVQDEWMLVQHDTKVNGEPIPEETRPMPGKRQYMTKWEPAAMEALENGSVKEYPPGRYKVLQGWINVRRTHLPDSYVIDQPKRNQEFNLLTVRQFGKGVRGQLDVGGWASIVSTSGEDVMMARVGDIDLPNPAKWRVLPGAQTNHMVFDNAPTAETASEEGKPLNVREVECLEYKIIETESNGVKEIVSIYGKVELDGKQAWVSLVEKSHGGLFERIEKGYNETPRKSIKKLQVKYQMMLPSDMVLLWDSKFKVHVERYAESLDVLRDEFGAAYQKLTELGCPMCPALKK